MCKGSTVTFVTLSCAAMKNCHVAQLPASLHEYDACCPAEAKDKNDETPKTAVEEPASTTIGVATSAPTATGIATSGSATGAEEGVEPTTFGVAAPQSPTSRHSLQAAPGPFMGRVLGRRGRKAQNDDVMMAGGASTPPKKKEGF